jgi:ubiquinone/menaquinone biosynthesis C-methylase UbiE
MADFVQAAAEDLPLPSNHFDVVYNIYMFHEMPDEARDAALKVRSSDVLQLRFNAVLNCGA